MDLGRLARLAPPDIRLNLSKTRWPLLASPDDVVGVDLTSVTLTVTPVRLRSGNWGASAEVSPSSFVVVGPLQLPLVLVAATTAGSPFAQLPSPPRARFWSVLARGACDFPVPPPLPPLATVWEAAEAGWFFH